MPQRTIVGQESGQLAQHEADALRAGIVGMNGQRQSPVQRRVEIDWVQELTRL